MGSIIYHHLAYLLYIAIHAISTVTCYFYCKGGSSISLVLLLFYKWWLWAVFAVYFRANLRSIWTWIILSATWSRVTFDNRCIVLLSRSRFSCAILSCVWNNTLIYCTPLSTLIVKSSTNNGVINRNKLYKDIPTSQFIGTCTHSDILVIYSFPNEIFDENQKQKSATNKSNLAIGIVCNVLFLFGVHMRN